MNASVYYLETTTVIAGLLEVIIEGYNLGNTFSDIVHIKVNGSLCTSIVHFSSNKVQCLLALQQPALSHAGYDNGSGDSIASNSNNIIATVNESTYNINEDTSAADITATNVAALLLVPFTLNQIEIRTLAGRTVGISTQPLTIYRSGSGRPAMAHIELNLLPFLPYALALVTPPTTTITSGSKRRTLYWSNTARGAYSIQRCWADDATQIETVVSNVS